MPTVMTRVVGRGSLEVPVAGGVPVEGVARVQHAGRDPQRAVEGLPGGGAHVVLAGGEEDDGEGGGVLEGWTRGERGEGCRV